MFHKQSDRRTFSLAHMNCCLSVGLSDDQQVQYIRMCFGGIGKHEVVKDITPDKDRGCVSSDSILITTFNLTFNL